MKFKTSKIFCNGSLLLSYNNLLKLKVAFFKINFKNYELNNKQANISLFKPECFLNNKNKFFLK